MANNNTSPDLPAPDASDGLIAAVEAAGLTATDDYSVANELRLRLEETDENQTGWTMTAFEYGLARRMGDVRTMTEVFGAKFSNAQGSYPTPIEHVPEEILALWESVAAGVSAPAVASRLHHRLFVRKHGDVGAHGRAAADAYAAIGANPSWSDLDRANAYHWAVTLYKRMGKKAEPAALLSDIVRLADERLGIAGGPGTLFHLLEILAYDLRDDTELPRLLKQARDLYSNDPWHFGFISSLEDVLVASDPGQRVRSQRGRVQAWIDDAAIFPPGLHRMSFLQTAAKLASEYGLLDLVAKATEGLQEIGFEALDLKPIGTTIAIPVDAFDDLVQAQLQQATLGEVMRGLVDQSPPSGNKDQNEAFATQMQQEMPFVSNIPTMRVSAEGLPVIGASSEHDHADERLAKVEFPRMGIAGEVVAQVIERACERFMPSVDDIVESFLWLPHVSAGVRRAIAKGLLRFAAGEYEDAVTLVIPKVETLVARSPTTRRCSASESSGTQPEALPLAASTRLAWCPPGADRAVERPKLGALLLHVPRQPLRTKLPERAAARIHRGRNPPRRGTDHRERAPARARSAWQGRGEQRRARRKTSYRVLIAAAEVTRHGR
jgi:hypothetical protein